MERFTNQDLVYLNKVLSCVAALPYISTTEFHKMREISCKLIDEIRERSMKACQLEDDGK